MFTGIIRNMGEIRFLEKRGSAAVLGLEAAGLAGGIGVGDSLAVNGVCLTITDLEGTTAKTDVSPETLARTTLGTLRAGVAVNLEPALALGERLDGHLVTGHVDCTGRITELRPEAGGLLLEIEIPSRHVRYLAVKGSVAVDGISLTVAEIEGSSAVVHVVPFTRDSTNLRFRRAGDPVNIETDLIAKYVERLLPGKEGGGLTWDKAELLR